MFIISQIKSHDLYVRAFAEGYWYDDKNRSWKCSVERFSENRSGVTQCNRTVRQVKDMYANLKCRAKKKEFERKATGGGPAILITPVEELVIEGIRNKPQLTGIPGGIETCDRPDIENEESSKDEEKGAIEALPSTSVSPSETGTQTKSPSRKSVLGKRNRKSREDDDLYLLEKRRAEVEIELILQRIKQEKELFDLKKEHLKETAQQDRTLFELWKELLSTNLKTALEQRLISFET